MAARPPLPTLLSQVLVAFTIEFDNEFEHRIPHRTTLDRGAPSPPGPWLVSQVMWANFMQFVGEAGGSVRELDDLIRITNLGGMERWGFVVVQPDPADPAPKPPRGDWLVRPTSAGRRAQQIWQPLAAEIEQRWQGRFGKSQIGRLTQSLQELVDKLDGELPRYLPVVNFGNGMRAPVPQPGRRLPRADYQGAVPPLDLSVLLAQALLAFTYEFEHDFGLSLAISGNPLRVLTDDGVRVRDLPRLAGVSKEAISASVGFLGRHGCVVVQPDPAESRTKLACLTAKGLRAQYGYRRRLGVIEERWRERFGPDAIDTLRESLQSLLDSSDGERPRISAGLAPYPDGWRARRPYVTQTTAVIGDARGALPHYPMVLHRGGWPDGS